jgi:hypothetical protein
LIIENAAQNRRLINYSLSIILPVNFYSELSLKTAVFFDGQVLVHDESDFIENLGEN